METMEQLRTMRANLPRGKKDPWGECCISKRVLLQRAFKRNGISELTTGENAALQEWLEFVKQTQKETKQLETAIAKMK